jgi:hypothetical protein
MTIEITMLHVEISSKVVKNDVMCHFCVNCHVNIMIDALTIKSQITLTNCSHGINLTIEMWTIEFSSPFDGQDIIFSFYFKKFHH